MFDLLMLMAHKHSYVICSSSQKAVTQARLQRSTFPPSFFTKVTKRSRTWHYTWLLIYHLLNLMLLSMKH